MREVFQRHLEPLDGKAYRVLECRIFGIRRQQALRRCMVQYILRLADPHTGGEQDQWVTGVMYSGWRTRWVWEMLKHTLRLAAPRTGREQDQWVTGVMYSGWRTRWMLEMLRFRRVWEGLRRSGPGRGTASSAFAPAYYVPELRMLVQVFPYDHRLPALPLLMAGPSPELEPLLLARFGPGDWQAEAWEVEPVRYRAELRATLRLTVRARDAAIGRAEEKRFYVKVYDDEHAGKQTHEALWELWTKADMGDTGFTVGRPVAYLSSLRVLVQEEVVGTSLKDMLLRGEDVTSVVRKVARALAALHLSSRVTPRRRPLQREVAIVERAGKLLRWACPHLEPEIEEIVGAVVAGLEEVSPAPTHCDLKLEHVMLDGDRLILMDLDEFAGADPILDIAHLLASLANVPLSFPLTQDRARAVARVFAEEYFTHVPEAWRERLPLHYAMAAFRVAASYFRHQTPGWSDKIEPLVEEAKGSLAGRVW